MRPLKGAGQPVLYVDFDGVLHHESVYWHPRRGAYLEAPERYRLFQHAGLLEEMLAPHPNVLVVLSTSWVCQYGCASAAKRLPAGLRKRVIGATYHSDVPVRVFDVLTRGEQVTQDVLRRRPGSWLAPDDASLGWPEWALSNFLSTDPYEGISPPEIQEAIRTQLSRLASLQLASSFPHSQQS